MRHGCWSPSSHEPNRLNRFQFSNTRTATPTNWLADLQYNYGYTVMCVYVAFVYLDVKADIVGSSMRNVRFIVWQRYFPDIRYNFFLHIMYSYVCLHENILFFHPSPTHLCYISDLIKRDCETVNNKNAKARPVKNMIEF